VVRTSRRNQSSARAQCAWWPKGVRRIHHKRRLGSGHMEVVVAGADNIHGSVVLQVTSAGRRACWRCSRASRRGGVRRRAPFNADSLLHADLLHTDPAALPLTPIHGPRTHRGPEPHPARALPPTALSRATAAAATSSYCGDGRFAVPLTSLTARSTTRFLPSDWTHTDGAGWYICGVGWIVEPAVVSLVEGRGGFNPIIRPTPRQYPAHPFALTRL
jgi:hypothetical protein